MKFKNNTILSIMLVLVALFLIAMFLYVILQRDRQEPLLPDNTGVIEQREDLTKEEILEAMSKPATTPPPTEEQKREILEAMSKPSN